MSLNGPEHHIFILKSRMGYLESKIEKKNCSEAAKHWHQSEVAALRFTLNILREIGYNTGT